MDVVMNKTYLAPPSIKAPWTKEQIDAALGSKLTRTKNQVPKQPAQKRAVDSMESVKSEVQNYVDN